MSNISEEKNKTEEAIKEEQGNIQANIINKENSNKEAKIIDAYNSGQSMNAIAKEFHTYPTSIRRILKRHNVKLRHDTRKKGELYVKDGEKLIEWAKAQGRLVTKEELAEVVGRKRLSPSYFLKYPELGQYVEIDIQNDLKEYYQKLYKWLKENNIPYKPNDRTKLKASVDALLLGEYSNIAIQISEKPRYVSKKKHKEAMQLKSLRAKETGITIIFLNKENFESLDNVKTLLDDLKIISNNNVIEEYNSEINNLETEIEKYNSDINNLKTEIEELQIIDDYFSNENYRYENVELSKLNIKKDIQEKLNQENIFTMQELITKYYNKINSLEKIPIEDLELSVRAYRCLKKININTLLDLIKLPEDKLKNIENLGKKTYYEIINKKKEKKAYCEIKQDEDEILTLNNFNIDIRELELPVRVYNCLRRNYIRTLYDLMDLTEEDLLQVKNLGKKGLDEILNKLSSMGLGLKGKDSSLNFIKQKENLMIKYEYEKKIECLKRTLKYKIEEVADIQNKKNITKVKMKRYYKAVEQYLDNEDIFNSDYKVSTINVNKENFKRIDNIKKSLSDLKIITDNNLVEDEIFIQTDKNEEKIEWKLENDKGIIDKVDKNIIEDEINKVDALKSDYLILTPSKSIKDTNFIQVCNEATTLEKNKNEKEKFYIEISIGDFDKGSKNVGKDNLTKEEVLKIFIEYFENNNLPEIKDWYEVKW